MPLHLPPISRRAFLGQATAAGVGWAALVHPVVGHADEGDAARDPRTFALFSDTHVAADPHTVAREVNMADHLRQAVAEALASDARPSGAIVNGDCAYLKGQPGDYATFAGLMKPLSDAGLPLHFTMGNHDEREPFYRALADQRPTTPPVESKHVGVIATPLANWFLLDTLLKVDVVTGELGSKQLDWLVAALDAHADKPAILMGHHNPQWEPNAKGEWGGLRDAKLLFEQIAGRKHVKAYIFGHTHDWRLSQVGDIHLVNLPPVAYVFQAQRPSGWVAATLREGGLRLQLNCFDKSHPEHGQTADLAWR